MPQCRARQHTPARVGKPPVSRSQSGAPRCVHPLELSLGQAITELLGQIEQADLRLDDFLFLGHLVISVPPKGGSRSQLRVRTAPRPPALFRKPTMNVRLSSSYYTKAKLLLELLIIALDPPAQFGDVDQLIKGNIREHGGKPIFCRTRFRLAATRSTTIPPGVARSA